ncbi:hypothetical protein PLICRDRAFT_128652 [Plicaturopsis crispa FD-325 SS-3]|nr:hypothetical protein PLICRDRAFT_128652 [Plicaturopsis crispa FD-325 SS-3]
MSASPAPANGTPSSLRNRSVNPSPLNTSGGAPQQSSPTLTDSTASFRRESVGPDGTPQSLFRATAVNLGTPTTHRIVIRADPALVTCFDPADRELYDLWVPKK